MSKNRYLTELAVDYEPLQYKAEGSYMSEKYDGVRAIYLPFTRNKLFSQIPWANRQRDPKEYVCSGLWTRRGKTIQAPAWFLDQLPTDTPLDGELYLGRKRFQDTLSCVRKHEPIDEEWESITYQVFGIPCYQNFFKIGLIREGGTAGDPAYECLFRPEWPDLFPGIRDSRWWSPRRFTENLMSLDRHHWSLDCPVRVVPQTKLPANREQAELVVQTTMTELHSKGSEGVMLRRGHMHWEPQRHPDLVKVKPLKDSEGVVLGYVMGKGRHEGRIGSVRLRWNNVDFDLSGLTDQERACTNGKFGEIDPGEYWDKSSLSNLFPIGSAITFLYNDLTDDGKPKFARYHRPAEFI